MNSNKIKKKFTIKNNITEFIDDLRFFDEKFSRTFFDIKYYYF